MEMGKGSMGKGVGEMGKGGMGKGVGEMGKGGMGKGGMGKGGMGKGGHGEAGLSQLAEAEMGLSQGGGSEWPMAQSSILAGCSHRPWLRLVFCRARHRLPQCHHHEKFTMSTSCRPLPLPLTAPQPIVCKLTLSAHHGLYKSLTYFPLAFTAPQTLPAKYLEDTSNFVPGPGHHRTVTSMSTALASAEKPLGSTVPKLMPMPTLTDLDMGSSPDLPVPTSTSTKGPHA
ncbi:hypothetical protein V8E53_010095 [Lactarius tabidus]